MILTLIVFFLLLTVLVLIHEAGHYFVAKKNGIKVEEFGFGFPPRLYGKKIGETIYSINWLPIGGFVKLYGEDEAGAGRITKSTAKDQGPKTKDLNRAFFAKTAWQRAAVVVAGVVMNTILAIVIFYVYMFVSGFKAEIPLLAKHSFFFVNQTNKTSLFVDAVSKNSPAEKAGIKVPAQMLTINGKTFDTTEEFVQAIGSSKGIPTEISWKELKTNVTSKATIIPRVNPPKGEGSLGIRFGGISQAFLSYDTPMQKAFSGITHAANLTVYTVVVMKNLVQVSVEHKTAEPISQSVSGPVGIYSLVGDILQIPSAKEKALNLLNLAGLLSISLAFFNILPIPAMDGGRLFFILIEAVTRKKVNQNIEDRIHQVGMIVLFGLIILITFRDIAKLLPH